MKSLISSIALSLVFLTICIGTFMGIELGAIIMRSVVVYFIAYIGGMLAASIIGVSYLSGGKSKPESKVTGESQS